MKKKKDNLYFQDIIESTLLIQHIRSDVLSFTHAFFSESGYMLIDPPILHEQIKNKKKEIYLPLDNDSYSLNSSNALYMGAYSSLFGNVYAISPCFREEESTSNNHLLEFKMLEVEMGNSKFDQLLDCVEYYIKFVLKKIILKYPGTDIGRRVKELMSCFNLGRISYHDFINKINQSSVIKVNYGVDLSTVDDVVSEIINNPVLIIDYPFPLATWTAKPKLNNIAYAFNLILPDGFGELAEGCERNNNVSTLEYKFKCAEIDNLQWYLDAIGKINTNRSGFGIGIDRFVRWIVGCKDIKETVLFPR